MAAQQCQGLTEKEVVVIPTATIPQGITAMMNLDPEMEPEEIRQAMTDSMETVTTVQITYAARNSEFDGIAISEGDYLSLLEGKLFGTSRSIAGLLEEMAREAKSRGAEFITLFYGEDVTEEEAERAKALFQELCQIGRAHV